MWQVENWIDKGLLVGFRVVRYDARHMIEIAFGVAFDYKKPGDREDANYLAHFRKDELNKPYLSDNVVQLFPREKYNVTI